MKAQKLSAAGAAQKPLVNSYPVLQGWASMGRVPPREPMFPVPIHFKSPISNLRNDILHKQLGQRPALSDERGKYIVVGLRCCAAAFLIFSLYLPNAQSHKFEILCVFALGTASLWWFHIRVYQLAAPKLGEGGCPSVV